MLLFALPLFAQNEPQMKTSETITVERILIDARVTKGNGDPITGLGVNDFKVTGSQNYQLKGTASSPDNNYNNQNLQNVSVTNTDTNKAGFSVTPWAPMSNTRRIGLIWISGTRTTTAVSEPRTART